MKLHYKWIAMLSILLISFSAQAQDTLFLINDDQLIVQIEDIVKNKVIYHKYDLVSKELESSTTTIPLGYIARIAWEDGKIRMTIPIQKNEIKTIGTDTIWLRDGTILIGTLLSDRGPRWTMRVDEDSVFVNWIISKWDVVTKRIVPKSKKRKKNDNAGRSLAIFLEGGGLGYLYSVNADVRLLKKTNGPGVSIGLGVFNNNFGNQHNNKSIFIPIAFNYLVGKERHFGELGLAMTLSNTHVNSFFVPYDPGGSNRIDNGIWRPYGFLVFGYRYAKPNGFFFRFAYTPFISRHEVIPFRAGVSVGFNFNQKNNKQ